MYTPLTVLEFIVYAIFVVTLGVLVVEFLHMRLLGGALSSYIKIVAILAFSILSVFLVAFSVFFGYGDRFPPLEMLLVHFGVLLPLFYVFFSLRQTILQKHMLWVVALIIFGTANTLAHYNFEQVHASANAALILAVCTLLMSGTHLAFILSTTYRIHCCLPVRTLSIVTYQGRAVPISFFVTVLMLVGSVVLTEKLLALPQQDSLESITLSYPYGSIFPLQFADLFMAQEAKLFLRKRIEVETLRGSPGGSIADTIVQGYATIGIAGLTDVLNIYASGENVFVPLIINTEPFDKRYEELLKTVEADFGESKDRYIHDDDQYYVFVVRRDVARAFPDLLARFTEGVAEGRVYIAKNKFETKNRALEKLGIVKPPPSTLEHVESLLLRTIEYLDPYDTEQASLKTKYWKERVAEYIRSHPEAKDIDFTSLYTY